MRQTVTPFAWLGKPVGALIFDLDGTLVHSKDLHAEAWDRWRKRHGLDCGKDVYLRDFFGRSDIDVISELFPRLANRPDELDAIIRRQIETRGGEAQFYDHLRQNGLTLAQYEDSTRCTLLF